MNEAQHSPEIGTKVQILVHWSNTTILIWRPDDRQANIGYESYTYQQLLRLREAIDVVIELVDTEDAEIDRRDEQTANTTLADLIV